MGAPAAFGHERELSDFEGMAETTVCLSGPGAVGRWAEQFCEERIELWATHPDADAASLAAEFRRTSAKRQDAFIEKHAEIWLISSDSTCWEIFARDTAVLRKVRDGLQRNAAIRGYESVSEDRGRACATAGIGKV
jgi:hypothetical protein